MSFDKVAQTNCPTVAFLVQLIHEMSQVLGKPGPEVIKPFSYSTQLSMKFKLFIKTKIPKNKVSKQAKI